VSALSQRDAPSNESGDAAHVLGLYCVSEVPGNSSRLVVDAWRPGLNHFYSVVCVVLGGCAKLLVGLVLRPDGVGHDVAVAAILRKRAVADLELTVPDEKLQLCRVARLDRLQVHHYAERVVQRLQGDADSVDCAFRLERVALYDDEQVCRIDPTSAFIQHRKSA